MPCPAFRAMPKGPSSANHGRRRPSPWRSLCTNAACSPGRNGRPPSLTRSSVQAAGDPDTGETYYRHWLNALERMVAAKGLADAQMLARYRDAWDRAAERTPHGTPIALEPRDFAD